MRDRIWLWFILLNLQRKEICRNTKCFNQISRELVRSWVQHQRKCDLTCLSCMSRFKTIIAGNVIQALGFNLVGSNCWNMDLNCDFQNPGIEFVETLLFVSDPCSAQVQAKCRRWHCFNAGTLLKVFAVTLPFCMDWANKWANTLYVLLLSIIN